MRDVGLQLRFATRSLTRARGFAATASLTLALGIGLSTAVFSVANAILLRDLPVQDQNRVVLLWGETRDSKFSNFPLDLDGVREFQRGTRTLTDVAFFEFRGATPAPISFRDRARPTQLALVSGNFFDVLGASPALGRALRVEDDVAGAAPVVVLSHRAWRQHFGGDSGVVGQLATVIATGRSHRIVGVMPQGLEYPRGTDFWAPAIAYASAGGFLDMLSYDLVGRLRPSASPGQARTELTELFQRPLPGAAPAYGNVRGVVHPLADEIFGDTKAAIVVVAMAAALLVLITCVNVANLQLVRALTRVREFAVRAAIGAGHARLVAQSLVESAILSLVGGLVGVALAVATVRAFVALAPAGMPRLDEVGVDPSALLASLAITTFTVLVAGVGPAIFNARVDAREVLHGGARTTRGSRTRLIAEGLVVAQIALAAVGVTAAALMTRSLVKLHRVDLSFAPEQLIVANLELRLDKLAGRARQERAVDAALARALSLPGVVAGAPTLAVPFSAAAGLIDGRLALPGQSAQEAASNPVLNLELASPDYFDVLGTPLLRGRAFTDADRDGTTPVIIVGTGVAQHFWPDADPIGQRLAMPGRDLTVVGLVPDTRYRNLLEPRLTVYFPVKQSPFPVVASTLLIRTTAASSQSVISALRREITETEPSVSVINAATLDALLDQPLAQPRLNTAVIALFAVSALSLAIIGLFAVIATLVRQRTREIGIRMALGATSGHVRSMVMARGIGIATMGAVIGIGAAVMTNRLLATLLFDVTTTDPLTLGLVGLLIVVVAAAASFVPARWSTRIDPIIALRSEG